MTVKAIEAGNHHTCALLSPCGAVCWGDNTDGQVGVDQVEALAVAEPRWIAQTHAFREIDLAVRHSCGLAHDGTVWCWGSNDFNQLDGTFDHHRSSAPLEVGGMPGAAEHLASGGFSNCVVVAGGTVACWGSWRLDALAPRTPASVTGVEGAVSVDRNPGSACAVIDGGSVRCWGRNTYGQLGDGTTGSALSRDHAAPVVGLPDRATLVAVGGEYACAILASGDAACWGLGDFGLLGDGTFESKPVPTVVRNLSGVNDMAANLSHVCAVLGDGGVACWGNNTFSTEPVADFATPQRVDGIANAVDVAAGAWYTCALTADQEIYCWGENQSYQLGLGAGAPYFVLPPTRVDWRAALP